MIFFPQLTTEKYCNKCAIDCLHQTLNTDSTASAHRSYKRSTAFNSNYQILPVHVISLIWMIKLCLDGKPLSRVTHRGFVCSNCAKWNGFTCVQILSNQQQIKQWSIITSDAHKRTQTLANAIIVPAPEENYPSYKAFTNKTTYPKTHSQRRTNSNNIWGKQAPWGM